MVLTYIGLLESQEVLKPEGFDEVKYDVSNLSNLVL